MNTKLQRLFLALVAVTALSLPAWAWNHYNILSSGYYDGPTVAGTLGYEGLFKVPLGLEVELGYSWSDLGDAIKTNQVFHDQNHNNAETSSSGGTLHLGFNATYDLPMKIGPLKLVAVAGPRYARWNARHQYLNENEDFDVVSHVWGLGGGVRGVMDFSEKIRGVLQVTLDYYWESSIYGHDTEYFPDNNNVNEQNNGAGYTYTYDDARDATAVPHIRPRVMIGLMF